ncbi:10013_t:CDS:2 [Entrophospora sp. SA101]|nr:3281_t:CDS:2 [Entrophospora sp. SA101]CAJ0643717.1 10013_t:CDS:2 [Entrophospora sp. SA101]CAJ0841590.1 9457_t:CDS:2 [Entrophospora sp. SA101]
MTSDREITLRQELDNCQNLSESLREQLERAHKENSTLTDDNNFIRRKLVSLQQEITNNNNEYARLETELYQTSQELERLKKENIGFLKFKREIERKLREETQAFEKDRTVWQEREVELLDQIKALQETVNLLVQQNEQSSKKNEENSAFNPASVSYYNAICEAKNAQKIIKDLERKVSELQNEADKTKQITTETMNINKNHVQKIQQLENEISQVKHMNRALMEDNENYQVLLHEKTMRGEFMLNPILQRLDTSLDKKYTDKDEKLTNGIIKENDTSKSVNKPNTKKLSIVTDLEAELSRASTLSVSLQGERVYKESDHTMVEKLQEEIKSLRDAHKLMHLYISKILTRILEAQGFEEILSTDWSAKRIESSPVSPTITSFNQDQKNDNGRNKIERRKTLSGFHFRSTSQPQNSLMKDKTIAEETESASDDLKDLPKKPQRRNSTSGTRTRRFSFLGWGAGSNKESKETEKKNDDKKGEKIDNKEDVEMVEKFDEKDDKPINEKNEEDYYLKPTIKECEKINE